MKRDFVTGRRKEIPLDDEETSLFMYVLTSIYMYLFIVVLAIVMAVNAMATSWENDIMGALTVQIIPVEDENKHIDSEKTLEQQNKVLQFMENVSGVKSVRVLSSEDIEKLMTPWLGNKVDISELPIPALLDVRHARLPKYLKQINAFDIDVPESVFLFGVPKDAISPGTMLELFPPVVVVSVFKVIMLQDYRQDLAEYFRTLLVTTLPRQHHRLGIVVHRVGVLV